MKTGYLNININLEKNIYFRIIKKKNKWKNVIFNLVLIFQ